jgi:hypothetical protein
LAQQGFIKGRKEQIWTKVLIGGPSGSGKTYSGLRLATGIAKKMGKPIAALDSENRRMLYYADEFEFDYLQLEAPYTPEKYIELINAAVDAGYGVLIIDSTSHEWDYILDVHQKMPGNSYTNWAKLTPRHDAFMEAILQSQIHIICTVRGKDEYVMEQKDGKQVPKKVGLGYKQRDNIEYNYTVTFNIAQDTHVADATKDNTHIFEGRYDKLTEKDGEALYEWANSSSVVAPKPIIKKDSVETKTEDLTEVIDAIDELAKELIGSGKITREDLSALLSSLVTNDKGKPTANYKAIKDMKTAQKVHEELLKI